MAIINRYFTESVEYVIRRVERQPMPRLPIVFHPCKLMRVTIGAEPEPLEMLCYHPYMASYSVSESDYCDVHHRDLTRALSSQFRFLRRGCAKTIATKLTGILRSANASHICYGDTFPAIHMIEVDVQPLSLHKIRPATNESVYELILKNDSEAGYNDPFESGVHKCGICTEEIETRRSAMFEICTC